MCQRVEQDRQILMNCINTTIKKYEKVIHLHKIGLFQLAASMHFEPCDFCKHFNCLCRLPHDEMTCPCYAHDLCGHSDTPWCEAHNAWICRSDDPLPAWERKVLLDCYIKILNGLKKMKEGLHG
ncbi:MAG: hypothetical protein ACTSSI_08525 [Candidatus Helarchaeota archaeon]